MATAMKRLQTTPHRMEMMRKAILMLSDPELNAPVRIMLTAWRQPGGGGGALRLPEEEGATRRGWQACGGEETWHRVAG